MSTTDVWLVLAMMAMSLMFIYGYIETARTVRNINSNISYLLHSNKETIELVSDLMKSNMETRNAVGIDKIILPLKKRKKRNKK